jgi:hypothetical protein
MTEDPRIDTLGSSAILTDTRIRLTFAPERPEARVVALEKEVRAAMVEKLASMMQLGKVHIQIKAGFGAERKLVLAPAEMVMIYDLVDRFIAELPRVDDKTK